MSAQERRRRITAADVATCLFVIGLTALCLLGAVVAVLFVVALVRS